MEYAFLGFCTFLLLLVYLFFLFRIDTDWGITEGEIEGNEIDMFNKANEKLEELIKGQENEKK